MKKILRWFLIFAFVFSLVIGAFAVKFSDTLFQEGNPLPIIKGIIQLQLEDVTYVPINKENTRFIAVHKADSETEEEDSFPEAILYMGNKGWAFDKQKGNELHFTKENKTTIVKTVMYTSDYYIFDVAPE
ncbi:hypothetical protein [Pontibacillus litoralis]|uniref:Uncharacterized protein n=1 Tax=Pontibacillus litoralis JSM 072002 TaxID=1385512 RepID=A0A0A5GBJ2_9BACI|nr:hypothetical protein [Pontibacillus litoralis]KGX88558.1 hypothetical protein N784_07765 [Pontibacillus litoralis JSM 072002]